MPRADTDAKVSAEGRVVIPSSIRRTLRIKPGDTVRFIETESADVVITTARALVEELRANNHGGDCFDAAEAVRGARADDQQAQRAAQDRIAQRFEQSWDEEREIARLLSALGLDQ